MELWNFWHKTDFLVNGRYCLICRSSGGDECFDDEDDADDDEDECLELTRIVTIKGGRADFLRSSVR